MSVIRRSPNDKRCIAAAVSLVLALLAAAPAAAAASTQHIAYQDWTSSAQLNRGRHLGTEAVDGSLVYAKRAGIRTMDGRRYGYSRWVSPVVTTRFGLTELVPSWSARTPGGSWVEVEARGTTAAGATSKWYVMGRWGGGDGAFRRTSAGSQRDSIGRVAVDTLKAGRRLATWQLRVTLLKRIGARHAPSVRAVGAVASRLPSGDIAAASRRGGAQGTLLPVPAYSQEKHRGSYPQWDGGGEAWCSPTSTSMVLRYWRSGPRPADYAWVRPRVDPWVVHAARGTFDYGYDGAGNWPFNTAYAARYGLTAFVTRLRSLTEAEQFIKAGIPLIVSMSFSRSDLDGAGYSTNGHLMAIVGFDRRGNVVANDPASHLVPSNAQVRVTYKRKQFENAWLPHSGGLTYVIHPSSVKLPPAPRQANW